MNPSAHYLHLSPALAAAAEAPVISFTEALLLLACAGLMIVTYHLRKLSRQLAALERRFRESAGPAVAPKPTPVAVAAVAPAGVTSDGPPPEIRVAIVAAVHAMLGRSARIVAVTDGAETSQVWSLEGRRQIFASHQIR